MTLTGKIQVLETYNKETGHRFFEKLLPGLVLQLEYEIFNVYPTLKIDSHGTYGSIILPLKEAQDILSNLKYEVIQ